MKLKNNLTIQLQRLTRQNGYQMSEDWMIYSKEDIYRSFCISDASRQLGNISLGIMATSEGEESLTSALDKGNTLAEQFVNERLVTDTCTKSFYDQVPRAQIKPNHQ